MWGDCEDCQAIAEVALPLGGSLNLAVPTAAQLTLLSSFNNANRITPRVLDKFTHLGSGKLRYDGADARHFIINATISVKILGSQGPLDVFMGIFVNGVPSYVGAVGFRSQAGLTSTGGFYTLITYREGRTLVTGDTVEGGLEASLALTFPLSDYYSLSIR